MYFVYSRDVDGCLGILQFIQKDSCEQLVIFFKVVGRYMTKFLAVETMYNRLYVVFTIKM